VEIQGSVGDEQCHDRNDQPHPSRDEDGTAERGRHEWREVRQSLGRQIDPDHTEKDSCKQKDEG
jgi:hypothetical protein